MEQNKEPNNPWEMQRVNINRTQNLMYDIKKPVPPVTPPAPPSQIREYDSPRPSNKKFYFIIFIVLLLVGGLAYTAFYFYQKSKTPVISENQQLEELDQTVLEVSKIAVLPITDSPTLLSVSDPLQLKNDAFFDNSEVGDKMLLYPRIGFAVLYRPGTKQIVNMMNFNPETESSTSTATTTGTTTNIR